MATLYSSGSPEGGSDSSEFLEKLQRTWSSVKLSLDSVDSTVSASLAAVIRNNLANTTTLARPGEEAGLLAGND